MRFTPLSAPPLLAASGSELRPVAQRVAQAFRPLPLDLVARARSIAATEVAAGRVHAMGTWSDDRVHRELMAALDPPLRAALRPRFEWYACRGAFFHTDAHYSNVLLGVWYVEGPRVQIAFARAGLRIDAEPGTLVIFDPFEVHGVLRPGAGSYQAEDYRDCEVSVFAGFELELSASVRARFGVTGGSVDVRMISSATRVSAATGALE